MWPWELSQNEGGTSSAQHRTRHQKRVMGLSSGRLSTRSVVWSWCNGGSFWWRHFQSSRSCRRLPETVS